MLKNFKERLLIKAKVKLRAWLDVDKLGNEIARVENHLNNTQTQVHALQALVRVGVDVHFRPPSKNWAVICIEDKPEYVKFVEFSSLEIREIQRFLHLFRKREAVIDMPAHAMPVERFFDLDKT
jgi:hypothetical protein